MQQTGYLKRVPSEKGRAHMASETLEGKVALVTGAGRGIGRAFAAALAAEDMRAGICARTKSQLDETADAIIAAGGTCHAVIADMSNPDGVTAMIEEMREKLGPIHLLVNNAAEPVKPTMSWTTRRPSGCGGG